MHLSISEASIFFAVSCCTLRRWDKSSKFIPDSLTPVGYRRYSLSNLKNFSSEVAEEENKKVIAYSRVSSHDQKDDLKRQSIVLNRFCTKEFSGHELLQDYLGHGSIENESNNPEQSIYRERIYQLNMSERT
jgi:predicted site-specific integrase-resolvase